MTPLEVAQSYFNAWNAHDAAAIVATFTEGGTYLNPSSNGELQGEAIGKYAEQLWAGFPDLSFEIVSAVSAGAGQVAAQWRMFGTNSGGLAGMPPTGRPVDVPGADFILIEGDKIRSVRGYFDSRAVPEQLGLQILMQPPPMGPFTFGSSTRMESGKLDKPGAISITWIEIRSEAEKQRVDAAVQQQILPQLRDMAGFIGWVGVSIGSRLMTITAWEDLDDPKQLLKNHAHGAAMRDFWSPEIASSGFTSVWTPARMNPMWMRCKACQHMVDIHASEGRCECGEVLESPRPYW